MNKRRQYNKLVVHNSIHVHLMSDPEGKQLVLFSQESWNCQTNTLARSIYPRSALRSLDARRGHAKKVGNFLLLCLVQVSCNSVQQEII